MTRNEQRRNCRIANQIGISPKQLDQFTLEEFEARNTRDIAEGNKTQVILSVLADAWLSLGTLVPVADTDATDFATALNDICAAAGDDVAFAEALDLYSSMFPTQIAQLREELEAADVKFEFTAVA